MTQEKKIFIIRFILFTIFACVLPFIFIAWRYQLFRKVDSIALSGWGLVAIIILFVFTIYVVKSLKKGLYNKRKWSMGMQIVNGLLKIVLPLLTIYFIINSIQNSIDLFKQSLIITIISEMIAIPINPLPKWEMESFREGEENKMNTFFDKAKIWWKGKDE